MSNLPIVPKWNPTINQVEKGEFITGGIDGNANLAPRQLAENIFWLKNKIDNPEDVSTEDNGFCKLPNGLTLQWGVAMENSIVQFPLAFQDKCFSLTATLKSEEKIDVPVSAQVLGQTEFKLINGRNQNDQYFWFAVGV